MNTNVFPLLAQRQWKMQKKRLADEFTTSLSMFQETQRRAAQKEKEQVRRVKEHSGLGDPFGGMLRTKLLITFLKMLHGI
jgi:hypothetical protein